MKTEAELIGYGLTGAVKIDSNHLNIALFSFSEILSELFSEILDEVDDIDESG
ncbi:hypothetical protein QUA74_10890 [Microcoleus sp. LAD1_D3]|uniref:hypothetical protein n=1 Tax=Microcoleus sp. LAD1_D3 TaxID=2819365 RepID=UPI002FD4AAFB